MGMNIKMVMSSVINKKGRVSTLWIKYLFLKKNPAPRSTFASIYVY